MKNVLIPIDFSDVTEAVLECAEGLARPWDGKLWLLHCIAESPPIGTVGEIPTFVPIPEMSLRERFPDEFRKLEELTASRRARGLETEMLVRNGSVVDSIIAVADQIEADLIVLGSHGHGALYELVVGTITQAVLQRSSRPILVVPTRPLAARVPAEVQIAAFE